MYTLSRKAYLCAKNVNLILAFFNSGADVNRATTTNDHTVLSLACAGGYLAVVELLLGHGAKPDHILKVKVTWIVFSLHFAWFPNETLIKIKFIVLSYWGRLYQARLA